MTASKKKISVKKILNKAFVLSVIVCLCISQSAIFVKADVVEFTEATKLGATLVDLYGQANNANLAYQNLTQDGALAEIINLYDTYGQAASDPITLAAVGAGLAVAGAVAVIYDAVTGQGYIQLYNETYINSLDGYWDFACNDAGLTRNAEGNYEYDVDDNGYADPVLLFGENSLAVANVFPIGDMEDPYEFALRATYIGRWNRSTGEAYYITGNIYGKSFAFINEADNRLYMFSPNAFRSKSGSMDADPLVERAYGGTYKTSKQYEDTNYQYEYVSVSSMSLYSIGVPVYSSLREALEIIDANLVYENIVYEPIIATDNIITFPDPTLPEYHPSPFRYTTNIPWNPEWGNPLPDGVTEPEYGVAYPVTDPSMLNEAVPELWRRVYVETVPEQDIETEANPDDTGGDATTTTLPLLPITLPDFNFSFSGIWHYVVDWVASLGSWFTVMFQMWNTLPYAMVLPVYATAVVVIVIGVYKRFFM